jgi:hypothetical protein
MGESKQRREFQLTDEELEELLQSIQAVPLIVLQAGMPKSPQERANDAWCKIGKAKGFDGMSVRPSAAHPDNPLFFTAFPKEIKSDG